MHVLSEPAEVCAIYMPTYKPTCPYPNSTTSDGMPLARRMSPMAAASDDRLCSAPATRPCTSPQHTQLATLRQAGQSFSDKT